MTNPTLMNRESITHKILDLLPVDCEYEQAIKTWWFVPGSSSNLRLSALGDEAFRAAGLEYHDIPYSTVPGPSGMMSGFSFISIIGRIQCPFYVTKSIDRVPQIRIYDSRVAMMMMLHGNVLNYLNSKKKQDK